MKSWRYGDPGIERGVRGDLGDLGLIVEAVVGCRPFSLEFAALKFSAGGACPFGMLPDTKWPLGRVAMYNCTSRQKDGFLQDRCFACIPSAEIALGGLGGLGRLLSCKHPLALQAREVEQVSRFSYAPRACATVRGCNLLTYSVISMGTTTPSKECSSEPYSTP